MPWKNGFFKKKFLLQKQMRILVKPEELNLRDTLRTFGGSFPTCKGRKYRYPLPQNHEAWMILMAKLYTYQNRKRYNAERNRDPPPRNEKLEYLYHCRNEQKRRRATRNRHREIIGSIVDLTGKHVHHTDRKTLRFDRIKVLTVRQHRKVHRSTKKKNEK